jgi:hypothetical protein
MIKFFILLLCISSHGLCVETFLRFDAWSMEHSKALSDYSNSHIGVVYLSRFGFNADAELSLIQKDEQQRLVNSDQREIQLFEQVAIFKRQSPSTKVLISIGGWEDSDAFSHVFSSKELSITLLENIERYIDRYDIQGIHINWRFLIDNHSKNNNDAENLLMFIQRFKQTLPNQTLSLTVPNFPNSNHVDVFDRIATLSD